MPYEIHHDAERDTYETEIETWGDLKRLMEAAGVGDDERIDYMDFSGARHGVVLSREEWGVSVGG